MLGWVGSPDVWVVGGREQRPSSLPRFGLWSWTDPTYLVCGCVVHQADTVDSLQEAGKKQDMLGMPLGWEAGAHVWGVPLSPGELGSHGPAGSRFIPQHTSPQQVMSSRC